ncbi:MAG: ROK family protein [Actinomycetota bacterium]|nr:ROK family protein [Actinomycetota bacterium]
MTEAFVAGVDVGGTTIKGGVVAANGATSEPVSPWRTASGDAQAVAECIAEFVAELRHAEPRVAAVGIGVPGIVDEARGVALYAVNVPLRDVALRDHVATETGLPVVLGHDVRMAARGEAAYGSARGYSDYLFVSIGTGVGAAVVIHGQPYAGAHHAGGELGHMVVMPGGPRCACGKRGCVEAVASGRALESRYRAAGGSADVLATDLPAADDERARAVWNEGLDALALALANYVTLLDPQAIVVGGGLAAVGAPLLTGISTRLGSSLLPFQKMPAITAGALGADAGWRGAAAAAWDLLRSNGA